MTSPARCIFLLTGIVAMAIPASTRANDGIGTPRISETTTRAAALRRVPDGIVKSTELETEHGRRIWSLDLARPDSPDTTEVQVDATTGAIVSVEFESAARERAESAADSKHH